jgi:uncharacterized protein YeaC (DUF1315 family)
MTPEFEAKLKKAVENGDLPNAVMLARDKSGTSVLSSHSLQQLL